MRCPKCAGGLLMGVCCRCGHDVYAEIEKSEREEQFKHTLKRILFDKTEVGDTIKIPGGGSTMIVGKDANGPGGARIMFGV